MNTGNTLVCNLALALLGEQRIKELSEDTKEGRLCSIHFEQTRREVIQRHHWRDARKRASLARLVDGPAFGWLYQFQLPGDLIKIIEVRLGIEMDTAAPQRSWMIEGTKLLTNCESTAILYVSDAPTVEMRPLLINAIATHLAAKMALSLTGDSRLQGALFQKAEEDTYEAWLQDAREHSSGENSMILRDAETSIGLVNARGSLESFGDDRTIPLTTAPATS